MNTTNVHLKKFSDEPYNNYKKPIRHIIIDGSNISSEYYMKDYISSLYSAYTDNSLKTCIIMNLEN